MSLGRVITWALLALSLMAVGYAISYWYPLTATSSAAGTAPRVPQQDVPQKPSRIEAQGRLEPASGTRLVAAIPGEQIVHLHAYPGKRVRQGEVLAELQSHQLRQAELALAVEQLAQAQRQLTVEAKLGTLRQEIAELAVRQAESTKQEIEARKESATVGTRRFELAEARLNKLKELRAHPETLDAVAEAELEQQQLLLRQIEVELRQGEAQLAVAQDNQKLACQAARKELELARLHLESLTPVSPLPALEKRIALTELAAEASIVRAPCDGTILEVYMREGERVANSPILQIGDLSSIVCVAEVHEASLKELQPFREGLDEQDGRLIPVAEHTAIMRSVAFETPLIGRMVEVGRLIGAPALRDPNPLAASDRRTASVRIELSPESVALAERFVHLQVNVTIELAAPPGER